MEVYRLDYAVYEITILYGEILIIGADEHSGDVAADD
jgi:hypothetical protein